MKNKKGMISFEVIIGVILLILVLAIVLYFLVYTNLKKTIEQDVCHQSVVVRGSVPNYPLADKNVIETPLKCKTYNICVTTNSILKGECESEFGKDYETVRVSSDPLEIENDINKIVADNAADGCWAMFGEGKISLFSREIDNGAFRNCITCSKIAFDKNVIDALPDQENKRVHGILRYLISTKMENSDKTYWQYLTNSLTSTVPYTQDIQEKDFLDLSQNQKAIIFYEVGRGSFSNIASKGGGAVVGALAGFAIGATVGTAIPIPIAGTFVGGGVGLISGGILGYAGYSFGGQLIEDYGSYFDGWNNKDIRSYGGYAIINYTKSSLDSFNCPYQQLVS